MRKLFGYFAVATCVAACTAKAPVATDGADAATGDTTSTVAEVPLQANSPWPKFRGDARQTGRSPFAHAATSSAPWKFATAKGIFSSPIVGADETVYIGSADRKFRAIDHTGKLKWEVETGEIIDSSGLLDDAGHVFFGSGDGKLYARDAATGKEVWTWAADSPKETGGIINWFEGNVAIGPDGTLFVPNDNFRVYAIDRLTGQPNWHEQHTDQTWSLPAVDVANNLIVHGNNQLLPALGDNLFALKLDGSPAWSASAPGSIAGSPLITATGIVVIGGFDGYVHGYDVKTGAQKWSFATRDHVYASAAELSDGTLIIPSCDGTIYALDPSDGHQRWAFDTLSPIRGSPAVDLDDRIYVGAGDGRLYVIEKDGKKRFSYKLIDADRNDLNASPALGREGVYLGGEDGNVFAVRYDQCTTVDETDQNCDTNPGESLPADGALLLFTSKFGEPLLTPPTVIDANQAMAFSLFVRVGGDTVLGLIDDTSLKVDVLPPSEVTLQVSGDRRFFTIAPKTSFPASKTLTLHVTGQWLKDPQRDGLKTTGGAVGGKMDQTFTLQLSAPDSTTPPALPLPSPVSMGDDAGVWEMARLAAPLPTILPSYNQIGFDSLHWEVGLIHDTPLGATGWVMGALPSDTAPFVMPDPETKALFPVTIHYDSGLITLENRAGLALEAMGASLSFDDFRLSARLDQKGEAQDGGAVLSVTTTCSSIAFYGAFLQQLGFCNPNTDQLVAFGAALLRPLGSGVQHAPTGVGAVTAARTPTQVSFALTGGSLPASQHRLGIFLEDPATGAPLAIAYGPKTTQTADTQGHLTGVQLDVASAKVPTTIRAWLMVDTYPAAMLDLQLP
jgi:outer membrane protein assembly factor BamB